MFCLERAGVGSLRGCHEADHVGSFLACLSSEGALVAKVSARRLAATLDWGQHVSGDGGGGGALLFRGSVVGKTRRWH